MPFASSPADELEPTVTASGKSERLAFGPAPGFPPEMCARRRARLLELIGDGVAVIPAGPELLKSRDTEIRYRQGSDFFYFTGFPEPQAVAVVHTVDGAGKLTLFVRDRDPDREVWTGARIGVDGAREAYGADAAYSIGELPARLPGLLRGAASIHYPLGADIQLDRIIHDALIAGRRVRPRSGIGPTSIVDLDASVGPMRLIKDAEEVRRMRIAAEIAAAGHREAMKAARPGAGEWEIQAALESTLRLSGAEGPSFPTIVGSGVNATTLHYVGNDRTVQDGDLILIDAGAEWGMYCSDITRTFPANGRFSAVQADLYDVVLAAEEAGIEAARPGQPVKAVHEACVRVLVQGMLDLGILEGGDVEEAIAEGGYKRFYMHQSSHWLGLDVHDIGPYMENGEPVLLQPGMVLTVEPGLYIGAGAEDVPDTLRGIGIRIEDDVLVTESGPELLTRGVPVQRQEIEELMV